MLDSLQSQGRFAVLLLCVLLVVMSTASPICPACDGLGGGHVSAAHNAGKMLPPTNDECNGVCSCCGYHWVQSAELQLALSEAVTGLYAAAEPSYTSRSLPPPFHPPRG